MTSKYDDDPACQLAISLLETSGPMGQLRVPNLLFCLEAQRLPVWTGKATCLHRWLDSGRRKWEEHAYDLDEEKIEGILYLLEELGIPGRRIDVKPVFDTSDYWCNLLFVVQLSRFSPGLSQEHSQTVEMASSGFEGLDANAFRTLLRRLFHLIGDPYRPHYLMEG